MRAPKGQKYCRACKGALGLAAPVSRAASISASGSRQNPSALAAFLACGSMLGIVLLIHACDTWWQNLGSEERARRRAQEEAWRRENLAREQEQRRRQEAEEEEKRHKAQLAAIEARRPPSERASLAVAALSDDGGEPKRAYCRARELLDPIDAKDRAAPDVRKALALMKAKEAPLLRAERAAFEKTRGLMCRDGTMSPTCRCHGPHRGCCSHHRGVAGCEPLPTQVSCP